MQRALDAGHSLNAKAGSLNLPSSSTETPALADVTSLLKTLASLPDGARLASRMFICSSHGVHSKEKDCAAVRAMAVVRGSHSVPVCRLPPAIHANPPQKTAVSACKHQSPWQELCLLCFPRQLQRQCARGFHLSRRCAGSRTSLVGVGLLQWISSGRNVM